ncbi:MAG TPA: hypothetical protein DDZ68_02900 [Parvularcula sp.]|nr:hypothetical protein [Parvularcula sp.]HBS31733.1 hypothetical protein [Parvularcula sp.]
MVEIRVWRILISCWKFLPGFAPGRRSDRVNRSAQTAKKVRPLLRPDGMSASQCETIALFREQWRHSAPDFEPCGAR